MDLKAKLDMYIKSEKPANTVQKRTGPDIHEIMDGTVLSNCDGSFFLLEDIYPDRYIHGGYPLGKVYEIKYNTLCKVFDGMEESFDIREFLFLDTETTGLSGGTGTVAFLVGVGFYKEDTFVLRQFLMRDYDEEPAMLRELNDLMKGYKYLVTFNGKAFDWNLLQTRFTFNRIKMNMKSPIHLDLLYPSRRIWKLKLESCRLTSLEENVLEEYRVDDIPGALIPGIYFKYLEDRNATEIKKVMTHNKLDIISMVSLLAKINSLLEKPFAESDGQHELLGVGRIFETGGRNSEVRECYESCMKSGNSLVSSLAYKRLVSICKRNRDYSKLAEYCEQMLSYGLTNRIPILIELAKYYEHRAKDMIRAIETVEAAISECTKIGLGSSLYRSELKIRHDRLKRKIASHI
ncbi:MAG: ribonuclease H-like domain-containing protein [Bacillota bacterium]|nr:ribonuclease H-like domain-containing protein [Bacillota bacterium]